MFKYQYLNNYFNVIDLSKDILIYILTTILNNSENITKYIENKLNKITLIIEKDNLFPKKTNVEFVEIMSRNEVTLNVWERGCGITLACGTGACATTVAGILNGYLDNEVRIHLPGGELKIEWAGNSNDTKQNVFMTGRADYSFKGEINI